MFQLNNNIDSDFIRTKPERLTDSELKMTGNDTGLLVVTGSISSQLEDFGCKILKNRRKINRGTSSDTVAKKKRVSCDYLYQKGGVVKTNR